jgi:hypothetical protein
MKKNIPIKLFILFLALVFFGATLPEEKKGNQTYKTNTNDITEFIAINQILMYFANNGMGSYNPITNGSGLVWPGGINGTVAAIFEDGLLFGGKVGTETRVGGSTYRYGLAAGPILPGVTSDASNPKYKIYRIRKGWELLPPGPDRDRYESDYNNWPVEDGAPWVDVDGDKIFTRGVDLPESLGDETIWFVMNDLDASRTTFLYGTQPMGLEIQCTIFGFNRTGPLGDMVFKKYKIINKGNNTIRDMILAYWSDPDLGYANDDYSGCDTLLTLGFIYNADNNDETGYGTPPPAAGYDFFQGPVIPYDPARYPIITEKNLPDSAKFDGRWIKGKTNLPLTSFSFYINSDNTYIDPDLGSPSGSIQMYYYMTSRTYDGSPFVDPNTGLEVQYCLSGDPIAGTGWYEGPGWPGGKPAGDRRITMSSGTFTMVPGDTQEVVVGILCARGTDNLNSLKVLKETDRAAQIAYDLDFNLVPAPPQPSITAVGLDQKIVFYWEDNSESYDAFDPLLGGKGLSDTTYTFEGYEVYQFSNIAGSDPVLLGIFDVENGITEILDFQTVQGQTVLLPVANGTDSKLQRFFEITTDAYSRRPLNNGSPYYIGVVAYGYCPNGGPRVLRTPYAPIEVFPQSPQVGDEYAYNQGELIDVTRTAGRSNGLVNVSVVDPNVLTGDKYSVFFTDVDPTPATSLAWNLVNVTRSDTIIKNETNFTDLTAAGVDSSKNTKIIDGFIIAVSDPGNSTSKVREVSLIKENGKDVPSSGNLRPYVPRLGRNCFGVTTTNETRKWWLASVKGTASSIQNLAGSSIGSDDYELRFTGTNNEYYYFWSGLANGQFKSNPTGKGTIPLEFWNIGNPDDPNDDKRLYVKVFDQWAAATQRNVSFKDSNWSSLYLDISRLDKDSVAYEDLYFVNPLGGTTYTEPIPNPSGAATQSDYPVVNLTFMTKSDDPADLPDPGTVIRIATWKPITLDDKFEFVATAPKLNNPEVAKNRLDEISVFPNPYFGAHALEQNKYNRFVRFTNLPYQATIRIFSLAGVFIQRIDKDDNSQFADWNLLNKDQLPVASGMYLAYIDLPGIGTKVLKIAVIRETQYIDRL